MFTTAGMARFTTGAKVVNGIPVSRSRVSGVRKNWEYDW